VIQEAETVRHTVVSESPTDGELLIRFQAGHEEAFAELYHRCRGDIYRYIVRVLGGDLEAAADVFQDTFVTIYRQAGMVRDAEAVRSWIYTIARNNCLGALKRQKRQVPLATEHLDIEDLQTPQPDDAAHDATLKSQLTQALAQLPENQREAVILHDLEGLSYAEVAGITSTNVGVVRQRLWRAKQALRIALAPILRRQPASSRNEDEDE